MSYEDKCKRISLLLQHHYLIERTADEISKALLKLGEDALGRAEWIAGKLIMGQMPIKTLVNELAVCFD